MLIYVCGIIYKYIIDDEYEKCLASLYIYIVNYY